MAASIDDVKIYLNDTSIPDATIALSLADAVFFLSTYGVTLSNPAYDILHRLYASHLLYMQGHVKVTSSESVGDVSASYDNTGRAGEESSPHLDQFFILLGQDRYISSP